MKGTIIILGLILMVLISLGCISQTETLYVCSTGEKVSDTNLCPKVTSTPPTTTPIPSTRAPTTQLPTTTPSPTTTVPPTTTPAPTTTSPPTTTPTPTTNAPLPTTTIPPTTTPIPSTPPPITKSKELSLKWSVDDTEFFIGDNYVTDISISDNGLIGAKFASGFTYVIDKEGKDLWHKKVAGPVSYAFYLQRGGDAKVASATETDNLFDVLSDGRIVKISNLDAQLLNKNGAPITIHKFENDKVRWKGPTHR